MQVAAIVLTDQLANIDDDVSKNEFDEEAAEEDKKRKDTRDIKNYRTSPNKTKQMINTPKIALCALFALTCIHQSH